MRGGAFSFGRTFPVILIVLGVISLAAALSCDATFWGGPDSSFKHAFLFAECYTKIKCPAREGANRVL